MLSRLWHLRSRSFSRCCINRIVVALLSVGLTGPPGTHPKSCLIKGSRSPPPLHPFLLYMYTYVYIHPARDFAPCTACCSCFEMSCCSNNDSRSSRGSFFINFRLDVYTRRFGAPSRVIRYTYCSSFQTVRLVRIRK